MKRWLCVGVAVLAGCQGTIGPAKRSLISDDVDDPRYSIQEQQLRYRDRIGLPDAGRDVGPTTGLEPPSQRGVQR